MEDAPSNPIDAPNEIVPEEKQESQNKEEPIETVTVTNGRRRGRRRVMKKKTVRDEEGYLGRFQAFTLGNLANDNSDQGRGGMGVFLRGRTCTQEGQDVCCAARRKGQEGRKTWSRQHHVFLLEEVGVRMGVTPRARRQ